MRNQKKQSNIKKNKISKGTNWNNWSARLVNGCFGQNDIAWDTKMSAIDRENSEDSEKTIKHKPQNRTSKHMSKKGEHWKIRSARIL